MKPIGKLYYFVILLLAVPIAFLFGLYFSSLEKGTPIFEGGMFDSIADFLKGQSSLALSLSYICYGVALLFLTISIFLLFGLYYGKASDSDLGLKINDRKRFKR